MEQNAIWKYKLGSIDPPNFKDYQTLEMPIGAQILTVQIQGTDLCIWALVDTNKIQKEERQIAIFPTGQFWQSAKHEEMMNKSLLYIGTFQLLEGRFIGHVFEVKDL